MQNSTIFLIFKIYVTEHHPEIKKSSKVVITHKLIAYIPMV